jgi:hypothetical protein
VTQNLSAMPYGDRGRVDLPPHSLLLVRFTVLVDAVSSNMRL